MRTPCPSDPYGSASALYLVKNYHLRTPVLRDFIKGRRLIVAVPTIDMTALRKLNPDATVLAYFHAPTVPHYGSAGGFYGRQREAMRGHIAYVRSSPLWITNRYGNYELKLTFDAYRAYAAFINGENAIQEFDGLYPDEVWGVPPQRWIDATGRADQPDIGLKWRGLMDYWISLLEHDVIVGNVGRFPLAASRLLDAITIEADHVKSMGVRAAYHAFGKRDRTDLCVAWQGDLDERYVMNGEFLPEGP